jgi:hypothetical protein
MFQSPFDKDNVNIRIIEKWALVYYTCRGPVVWAYFWIIPFLTYLNLTDPRLELPYVTFSQSYYLKLNFSFQIRLGLANLSDNDESVSTKNIVRIVRHPKHRAAFAYYDIAVVQVDPVRFSDRIGPGECRLDLSFTNLNH